VNCINRPVPIIPIEKHIHAIKDDLCIFFSTILPAKAADIPKKNIARENAHPVANVLIPILSAIASLKVDQQYTVPIEQCKSKAGMAALTHLLFKILIFTSPFLQKLSLLYLLVLLFANIFCIIFKNFVESIFLYNKNTPEAI